MPRISLAALFAVAVLAGAPKVGAGPSRADETAAPRAASDEGPNPAEARNVEVDPDAKVSLTRKAAQIALLPIRGALWLVFYPVREGLFLLDRYQVVGRAGRLFSGDGAFTIYPSIKLEAGRTATYGIGAGYRNVVRLQFLFGGEARQVYGAKLRTRDLLGETFELDAEAELQLLRDSRFNGIGNESTAEMPPVGVVIDPLSDDTSIAARFNQDILRVELGAWVKPRPAFAFRLSSALLRRDFARASDEGATDLIDAYEPDALIGYSDGLDQIYSELRFVFDDRRQPHPRRTVALPTTGWHLTSWLGLARGFRSDPSRHVRYGFDAQRFLHLYGGDRVLVPRLWFEGVSGSLEDISFVDLPSLGGSRILRGYTTGRFRDRLAGAGGLEYRFPIHSLLSGFLFADAGRVFRDYGDLTLDDLHAGAGAGLIVHTIDRFILRAQVAVGEDGVLFNASLSPSDRVKRATRRR